jgi:ankyrin repeat protein
MTDGKTSQTEEEQPVLIYHSDQFLQVFIALNFVDLVQKCIKDNKDCINMPDQNGVTPLGLAVRCGNLSLVQLLLEAGADPDQPSAY